MSETVDLSAKLKRVLRFLPAPVGIVTSEDPASGEAIGLAMSALMPVSLEPCSMAIAVNRSGSSHKAILEAGHFCINLLDEAASDHLGPFAGPERRDERFRLPGWAKGPRGWYIKGAPANIFCRIREILSYGTHDLIIGEVEEIGSSGETGILGWANGSLGTLSALV